MFAASRELRGAGEIERGFYSLIYLARALAAMDCARSIDVVSSAVQSVVGDEPLCPERAAVIGACRVIPQEMPSLSVRHIDVPIPIEGASSVELLASELAARAEPKATAIAHRGGRRWVESFAPFTPTEPARSLLRRNGTYLVTGGLGEFGVALAEHLVATIGARVALVSRSPRPPRDRWDGGDVLVCAADVADRAAMARVLGQVEARFGSLHGVFHGAAVLGDQTLTPIDEIDPDRCDAQFHGKVRGAAVLAELLADRDLDFVLLHSSLSAVLGGIGMAAYAAANACLDTMAHEMARRRGGAGAAWFSVDWDGLRFTEEPGAGPLSAERTLPPSAIFAALEQILGRNEERWLVLRKPLEARRTAWIERAAPPNAGASADAAPAAHGRPGLSTEYVAPRDEVEETIAAAWRDLFGIDRIGVHDDFFELGGDSLTGIRILGRVREAFQIDLHAAALFEHRTVAALAARVMELLLSRHAAEIGDAEMSALLDEIDHP
jgi:NAD(P)-dependent dehydrogenase (short-subunit alcohol dehydrogenase family)/acyl carrier protein